MVILLPQAGAVSDASIAELTAKYGSLPAEYVDFLRLHDGAKPPPNVLAGTNYSVGVHNFLLASEIPRRAGAVEGLSPKLLPFGEDDSGNFICIGIDDHRIYFWDHEFDGDQVVAENFNDFIERLEDFKLNTLDLQPGRVINSWVNQDFKPEF